MWDRICIFIGIVIFSRDVYILHSGTGSEVVLVQKFCNVRERRVKMRWSMAEAWLFKMNVWFAYEI